MSVKIDSSRILPPLTLGGDTKAKIPAEKAGDLKPAAAGTNVSIGPAAAHARSAESNAAQAPMDASRIAEIKQAITEGRIQINTGAVSDSLIRFVTDLVAPQSA